MPRRRVLAIGLDGYETSLGDRLMDAGELPHLEALRKRSARYLLDHGAATRTGLAWEHASTGLSPEHAHRASAIEFDAVSYDVWHAGTSLTPFPAHLSARTVVFDPPYFDLGRAPSVRGVVNWGAHDPGIARGSRPGSLVDELITRFGEYPAKKEMYDIVWASPERTRVMGDALIEATEVRARAARWLLAERCPDWDLAFVVAGEIHSAIENFWHGIDAGHPLHGLPSAPLAEARLRAVYRATDALVGKLADEFPDAAIVAFSMNGMGPNRSDVASMLLLPELLYRNDFGRPLLRVPRRWSRAANGIPMLESAMPWSQAIKTQIRQYREPLDSIRRIAARVLPEGVKERLRPSGPKGFHAPDGVLKLPIDWMPTDLYRPHWPASRCFALPSFYDGRIRFNLEGRERTGRVGQSDYEALGDEIEALLRECRDTGTGRPIVDHVVHCGRKEPLAVGPTECDLIVVWSEAALGIDHPRLGKLGPVPYRRPGGHTGPHGMAYLAGDGIGAGDFGVRKSFDVVPTLFQLAGERAPEQLSGRPLI